MTKLKCSKPLKRIVNHEHGQNILKSYEKLHKNHWSNFVHFLRYLPLIDRDHVRLIVKSGFLLPYKNEISPFSMVRTLNFSFMWIHYRCLYKTNSTTAHRHEQEDCYYTPGLYWRESFHLIVHVVLSKNPNGIIIFLKISSYIENEI